MKKNEEKETKMQKTEKGKEKEQQQDLAPQKVEPKFIDVPIDVIGKLRNKNYVDLKDLAYNTEKGHLSFHLGDKHTMIFKDSFQRDYLKVVVKEADQIEQSVARAPQFERSKPEKSTARMRLLGERDGRVFVGPSGSVKYDGSLRGLIVNLDDKHTLMIDSETLSKKLGIKISPIAMERKVGIAR
jgi:hypothetical protein